MLEKETFEVDSDKPDPSNIPSPDDETLVDLETDENTGMDMGTTFKEDKEQDLDDLIHNQGTLKRDEIPPPEES